MGPLPGGGKGLSLEAGACRGVASAVTAFIFRHRASYGPGWRFLPSPPGTPLTNQLRSQLPVYLPGSYIFPSSGWHLTMQRRPRGLNAGLMLLLSQIFHVGINNIPPVTLATLAVNVWFFLSPLKPLYSSCLSVEKCYQERDWQRLLLSPFHHADDWHLYFNMVSMLWKGIHLERRLGSRWFAYVITTFSLLTGLVYLFLEFALAECMGEPNFKRSCAVGFSGVLFALKVLNNHYCPGGFVTVLGFPVPNRFGCWAELVAIHLISPGTSFAGHLAGILVGLMYTHGPLKKIMETCAGIFSSNNGYSGQQYYFNNSGYSGSQDYYPYGRPGYQEETSRNYDAYTGGLSEEEQLERALRDSLWDRGNSRGSPPSYGFRLPPEEEMRRMRLHRFDRQ